MTYPIYILKNDGDNPPYFLKFRDPEHANAWFKRMPGFKDDFDWAEETDFEDDNGVVWTLFDGTYPDRTMDTKVEDWTSEICYADVYDADTGESYTNSFKKS